MLTALGTGTLVLSLATSSLFTGASPTSGTPIEDVPAGASIELLKYEGSGCEPGTANVAHSGDHGAVTVTYSSYLTLVGVGGDKLVDSRRCKITVRVNPSPGHAAAYSMFDQRGYGLLPQGAAGVVKATYQWVGSAGHAPTVVRLPTPLDDDWQTAQIVPEPLRAFGACGAPQELTIDTEFIVAAGSPDATAYLGVSSTDLATNHFVYKDC